MSARTIWRFPLEITDRPTLEMPNGSNVLSVGPPRGRDDVLDLWAAVDSSTAAREERHFRIVGTGNPMPEDALWFVGTVVTHGGALVWHVFEAHRFGAA